MKTKQQHTPTPWYFYNGEIRAVVNGKDIEVFKTSLIGDSDGRLIVKAVNSHKDLINSAKCALRELRKLGATCQALERSMKMVGGK